MKLVFATHNQNKFQEVKLLMPDYIVLLSLTDISCFDEIEETGTTLEENAQIKANYVTKKYDLPCFSDDTGLLVNALNGKPGVYSARYAGNHKNSEDNMAKLLHELKDENDRRAYFKTVIALNLPEQNYLFKGEAHGEITIGKQGEKGFGYDPIFKPLGYDQTFAQLTIDVKNKISHRGKAIDQLVQFLKNNHVITK
ncbi:non-canonical purine NTP diphosphatase [Euzebyella saccharophila]|uniref:dITP/XTP pyrophosphatase n=1 Tax=Euzebyella saccharophila TaxID=679664 RepID=A0ABV8JTT6_9FLAO|nr:non-canonical purine NTP diphosphatase [Euzebyella saccharophila]MDO1499245.1 non-canonical purine NTP diphosphatase [Winogradskyella maritima]